MSGRGAAASRTAPSGEELLSRSWEMRRDAPRCAEMRRASSGRERAQTAALSAAVEP